MRDEFDSRLRAAIEDAEGDREKVKRVERLSREEPEELAAKIAEAIPYHMEQLREEAAREWGVDIADLDGLRDADVEWRSLSEGVLLLARINVFQAFAELLRELDAYAADPSLPREQLVEKVCETGVKALRVFESSKLHTSQQIRAWAEAYGSEEAVREARATEASLLAGHLATRISMRNRRLARALDKIRERKKPASRERFETLLRELYVLAPDVWDEHHRTDWQLLATRSALVKKIERRLLAKQTPPVEETELAAFAERESLLKRGRQAGLTPREYELFKLFVEKPDIKYREAAQIMGITVGTVGALKSRIKAALNAA